VKLYVFPDESQDSLADSGAFQRFLSNGEANDESWYLWPENALTWKQRQKFDPEANVNDVIVSNDPFIISAFHSDDVTICKIERGKVVCKRRLPVQETFGTSCDHLLTKLFGVKQMISDAAIQFMSDAIKGNKEDGIRDAIMGTGESFVKRHLYEALYRLEDTKKGKK
jgi:hypothetical protein